MFTGINAAISASMGNYRGLFCKYSKETLDIQPI